MSKFPLQSLVKQRWLALTHVHPCDTYFSMSFLSYSEISALFFFQTESFYFIYGTKITANAQTNSTTDRADSVKISCWKVPLIFFSSIGGNLMVKVCHVITVKKKKWISSTLQQVWQRNDIYSGATVSIHHKQFFSHNSYYKQCVI